MRTRGPADGHARRGVARHMSERARDRNQLASFASTGVRARRGLTAAASAPERFPFFFSARARARESFAGSAAVVGRETNRPNSTCSHKRAHYACMDGTHAGCWCVHALSDGILLFRLIRIQGNVRRVFKRFRISFHALLTCWPPFGMFEVIFVLQACKSLLDLPLALGAKWIEYGRVVGLILGSIVFKCESSVPWNANKASSRATG
jgi:hypothetical protein